MRRVILVPTDFSDTARNAIGFAMQLAAKSNAKVVLFHAQDRTSKFTEEEIEEQFRVLKKDIDSTNTFMVETQTLFRPGSLGNVINTVVKEKGVDLIIMGTNGASKFMNFSFGSNAAAMIDYTRCPLLVVPPQAKYHGINRLVLAVDHRMDFLQVPIARLRKMFNFLGGNIFVLSVIQPDTENVPRAVMDVQSLNTLLNDIPHSFHYIYTDDVPKGLNDFANLHYADIIITLPQKHSWASKILSKSHTREMVYNVTTPILALQD